MFKYGGLMALLSIVILAFVGYPHRRRGAVSGRLARKISERRGVRPTVDAGMKSPVRSAQRQTRGAFQISKKATPDFES